MESQNSGMAAINVYLEGPDGNLVSGAVVMASNNQNAALKINFDAAAGSYKCDYPIPADGIIKITVRSVLLDNPVNLTIEHKPINIKPVLQIFEDSAGNSVLGGQSLRRSSPIQIAWNSCGTGTVYQVLVKTAFQTLFSAATDGLSLEIPAETIPAGNGYAVQVIAQNIAGDPFFQRSNYYSCSAMTGNNISFNVTE
ncbi:hypothetical protein FACS189442_1170 [Spirochaetia bacterium]|nr:hypothetical protein FACS189442_1170 [Spirochaetia bacterium]